MESAVLLFLLDYQILYSNLHNIHPDKQEILGK